jgi:two-component system nitrogen regulation sensor histidine kinase GlnL
MIPFDSIINSLDETIILFNRKTKAIYINKAGEELLRRSAKDIVGKRFSQLVTGKEAISSHIKKSLVEGRSFKGKSIALDIGKNISVDFGLSPFFVNDQIEGVILSLSRNIDIAEREDIDFDSVVYLLGSIAHEIKNPLGGIKGAAQLLGQNTQGASIDEYTDLIVRETDRLDALLNDYLTVCKNPSFGPVNVHEILEKALAVMNTQLKKSEIKMKRLYDPSLPGIRGDEGKLLQVFLNIIKNAVESMKNGGKLEIATYPSKELFSKGGKTKRMAVIAIRDSGKGIERKDLEKIFMPFYTKKRKGAGIGLAFSKKSIKDHGGFITVKSQKKKGTCFSIYLPYETIG